jgi:hypothetical protein
MPELHEERLERLRAWQSDLERLIADATRAGDTQVIASARAMLDQCQTFISEAEDKRGAD